MKRWIPGWQPPSSSCWLRAAPYAHCCAPGEATALAESTATTRQVVMDIVPEEVSPVRRQNLSLDIPRGQPAPCRRPPSRPFRVAGELSV